MTCVIGIVCGIAVYFSVLILDSIKIDDPVGALSVHLVCGIIGTLPLPSITVVTVVALVSSSSALFLRYCRLRLRSHPRPDRQSHLWLPRQRRRRDQGLDAGEHGMAYHGLSIK